MKNMINLGVHVNYQSERIPPLLKTINEDFKITKLLINAGADINYVDSLGNSALSRASYYGNIEIVKFLIFLKVDINKCGGKALNSACINGHLEIVKLLIDTNVNVNFCEKFSRCTPLHCSSLNNNFEVVKFLLENSGDENIKNLDGKKAIDLTTNNEIKQLINNCNNIKFP